MKTMSWTKRITLSAGLALTSLVAVPAVAGAAAPPPDPTPHGVELPEFLRVRARPGVPSVR